MQDNTHVLLYSLAMTRRRTMIVPEPETSPGMQRVLRVLEKKSGMSVSDLSAEAFIGVTTLACGGYIRALKKHRLIFISGWRQLKGRFSTPLYSLGDQPDVPRPLIDDSNRDAPGMWRILDTLKIYGPLSYRDIARFSGLSLNTVKNSGYLDALIAQERIHIGGWQRSTAGPMSPLYFYGPGKAVPKPPALGAAEKSRMHRKRNRIAARGTSLAAQMTTSLRSE